MSRFIGALFGLCVLALGCEPIHSDIQLPTSPKRPGGAFARLPPPHRSRCRFRQSSSPRSLWGKR